MKDPKPLALLFDALQSDAFTDLKHEFSSLTSPYRVRKGRILVDVGQVNDHIYFIHSGVIRTYYHIGGEDVTSRLAADGDMACVAESFFLQQKSNEAIETLEDCLIYSVSYTEYKKLAERHVLISNLIVRILEQRLVNFSERVKLFKSLTVEKRIESYLAQPNSLFRRIPDHYVASYLGTTPATFSRCLKMLLRDKPAQLPVLTVNTIINIVAGDLLL
jgi:CRP/FNR family transcriptional regulator, anaerobic regulatory protein